MPADGVSLPTTLAQLGSVAKAQARATSQAQPATAYADQQEKKGELAARKVQETREQQAQRQISADQRNLDKRQRRRQKRQGRLAGAEHAGGPDDRAEPEDGSPLGHLVDLRA